MKFDEELKTYIRAGYPVLYVASWEEERLTRVVMRACEEQKLRFLHWTTTFGLVDVNGKAAYPPLKDPDKASSYIPGLLAALLNHPGEGTLFLIKDFHPYIKTPLSVRLIRDIVSVFKATRKTLLLLSPIVEIPTELEKDVALLEFGLPDAEALGNILDGFVADIRRDNPSVRIELDDDGRESLIKAMLGLTQTEVENTLARIVVRAHRISAADVTAILGEKEQIIRKSGILEFYASIERFRDIGGLEELKDWLQVRSEGFSERAKAMGLPAPKGILLLGVPGCGKSLSAKAVAAEWAKPLLRFDLGRIYGKYLGESEANLRRAIQVAESVAPCVLWIDEIEKALAGAGGGGGDGGTSQRIFGTLLTWMEEKSSPVFVVTTANNIDGLPPELLRKGRLDEIFFVDLPNKAEREQIFRVHLQKRNRDPVGFDILELVAKSDGFSGAEIEQAVVSALFTAFSAQQELDTAMIVDAMATTVPLSRSMKDAIDALRAWAADRCRPASGRAELTMDSEVPMATGIDLAGKLAHKRRRVLGLEETS